jgi:copper chaperone
MIAFQVDDMTCGHCARAITTAIAQVDAAADVTVDLPAKRVEIRSPGATSEALGAAIRGAGYTPVPAAASAQSEPPRAGGCCGCR